MVPSISSLIKENPDKIVFQGEKYGIHSEECLCTVTVIYNIKDKRVACIVSMKGSTPKGSTWVHKSNDKAIAAVLNEYFWESIPWHSDIMEILKKHGYTAGTEDRYGGMISGRWWEVNTGPRQFAVLASFWQGHQKIKSHLDYVKVLFQLAGKDITKAFFEFPNKDGQFLSYNEAFTSLKPAPKLSKDTEKELQKIQHLSPDAKKALIRLPPNALQQKASEMGIPVIQLKQQLGMNVAETQDIDRNIKPERSYHLYNLNLDTKPPADNRPAMWINEDPDSLYIPDDKTHLEWARGGVVCVFSIFDDVKINRRAYVAWGKYYSGNPYHFVAYPDDIEQEIVDLLNHYDKNTDDDQKWRNRRAKSLKSGASVQHLELLAFMAATEHTDVSYRYDTDLDDGVEGTHGRVWLHNGMLYASFWNTREEVKHDIQYVKDIFSRCKLDMDECFYEFIDHDGLMDKMEAFGSNTSKEKRGEEAVRRLMMKQHTDPNAKRVLAQMHELPVNKLRRVADKLNMTPIKLYQMLHGGD